MATAVRAMTVVLPSAEDGRASDAAVASIKAAGVAFIVRASPDQRTENGLLSAARLPAALVAVTLHCTLWPRSLLVTTSVRPFAPGFGLPAISHR